MPAVRTEDMLSGCWRKLSVERWCTSEPTAELPKRCQRKPSKEMSHTLEIITKPSKEVPGGSHYGWCRMLLAPGTAEPHVLQELSTVEVTLEGAEGSH